MPNAYGFREVNIRAHYDECSTIRPMLIQYMQEIPQGSLQSFRCQQRAAFALKQVELKEKVICMMNIS